MDNHMCPVDGCSCSVIGTALMCAPHWYMVPKPLRKAVWAAWADGAGRGTTAHYAAITAAVRAVNAGLAR